MSSVKVSLGVGGRGEEWDPNHWNGDILEDSNKTREREPINSAKRSSPSILSAEVHPALLEEIIIALLR